MTEFWEKVKSYFLTDGVTLAKNLALILLFYMIIKTVVKILKKSIGKSKKIEKTMPNFIISLINIILMAALVIFALQSLFHVSTDSVVTIASVLTLGISLALQDTISSLANGILIIATKPFVEGEYVTIDEIDISGTVVSITMFNTVLKTPDGLMITVPNSAVVSNSVINYSRLPVRRVDVTVPVAYGSDVELVKKTVLDLACSQKGVLSDPSPSCRLSNYGDSNLEFVLKVWVPGDIYWDTKFDLNEKLLKALKDAKIQIDYNQYDVHIRDLPAQAEGGDKR